MFTILDHTADLHIRVEENSLEELFVEAARAMVSQMYPQATEPILSEAENRSEQAGGTFGATSHAAERNGTPPDTSCEISELRSPLMTQELVVSLGYTLPDLGELNRANLAEGASIRLPPAWEDLFHDWLSKVLVLCTADRLLPVDYRLTFERDGLRARLAARRVDPAQEAGEIEIKAVTYHGLKLERTATGYRAEVIFDT